MGTQVVPFNTYYLQDSILVLLVFNMFVLTNSVSIAQCGLGDTMSVIADALHGKCGILSLE